LAAEPLTVAGGFFLIYVVMAALSLPGATLLTLLGGALFGFGWGLLIISFASTLGATLATFVPAAATGVAGPAGWPADGWLLMLAGGSQVIGWLVLTTSIHHLPAAATSVALLLQPVLALVWGAVLLSEPLGLAQVAGAVTVLLGVGLAHRGVAGAEVPDHSAQQLDIAERPVDP
jgi:drug/metabolite transporter (DMT)-like permease